MHFSLIFQASCFEMEQKKDFQKVFDYENEYHKLSRGAAYRMIEKAPTTAKQLVLLS